MAQLVFHYKGSVFRLLSRGVGSEFVGGASYIRQRIAAVDKGSRTYIHISALALELTARMRCRHIY